MKKEKSRVLFVHRKSNSLFFQKNQARRFLFDGEKDSNGPNFRLSTCLKFIRTKEHFQDFHVWGGSWQCKSFWTLKVRSVDVNEAEASRDVATTNLERIHDCDSEFFWLKFRVHWCAGIWKCVVFESKVLREVRTVVLGDTIACYYLPSTCTRASGACFWLSHRFQMIECWCVDVLMCWCVDVLVVNWWKGLSTNQRHTVCFASKGGFKQWPHNKSQSSGLNS